MARTCLIRPSLDLRGESPFHRQSVQVALDVGEGRWGQARLNGFGDHEFLIEIFQALGGDDHSWPELLIDPGAGGGDPQGQSLDVGPDEAVVRQSALQLVATPCGGDEREQSLIEVGSNPTETSGGLEIAVLEFQSDAGVQEVSRRVAGAGEPDHGGEVDVRMEDRRSIHGRQDAVHDSRCLNTV
jgi:hypothetical protein